ncbi:peptidase [Litorimonas cladophorae]|uniref:Peptidase n=1 Tax=Litorimonas cladophorae TaxID=1220491 RepID=A0A918KG03_9PROT|nr:type I secretion system permease/ATPase [Litorimonas cladophorae]GGX62093.1 peptidase [Litorimonas cladophorae]
MSTETFSNKTGTVDWALNKSSVKPYIVVTLLFSLVVNLLMLVSPLYMLQVYDRVLSSGSVETLIMVSIAAIGLLSVYGFAEAARRKTLALMSEQIQNEYGPVVFMSSFRDENSPQLLPKKLADLSTVQNFLRHGLLLPFFDLPFTPLFLLAMFLVHPIIGWIGVIGGLVLILITVFTELSSRKSVEEAMQAETVANNFANEISRNRSVISSLGMVTPLLSNWMSYRKQSSKMTMDGLGRSTFFSAQAKGLRQMLQVAALGVGGFLVLQLEMSAGAIIAGSILMGRALAPIDQALGAWRQLIRARSAWFSLEDTMARSGASDGDFTPMLRPDADLSIESLMIASPGSDAALLPKFNVNLKAGASIAILGPSGSGKTSLLQTIVGAWEPLDGRVRLGGRDMHNWDAGDRGKYIGYAPQDVELLPGTIAQNISRFSDGTPEDIMGAAQKAGFHDMILRLPEGYDTRVGPGGSHLSQGQQKGVGLARAIYRDPVLLVLDEPGTNLDRASLLGLQRGLAEMKSNGNILIFATHDMRLLSLADNVLLLDNRSLKMVSTQDYMATMAHPRQIATSAKEGAA